MLFTKKAGGVSWVVAFLGNPGAEYANTRHNAGFMTADLFEKQESLRINKLRFSALTAVSELEGVKALLVKPQTYMNLSGNAVRSAAAYYKIPPERVIVVCDDISLPPGKIRVRKGGSAGGHNGLKSIISALATEDFPRVKIGVGSPDRTDSENAVVDWVLGAFSGKDAELIAESCDRAAKAVRVLIRDGAERAMNMFN